MEKMTSWGQETILNLSESRTEPFPVSTLEMLDHCAGHHCNNANGAVFLCGAVLDHGGTKN